MILNFRDRILKWNGWGYADSSFELINNTDATLTGNRLDFNYFQHFFPGFMIRPF